MKKIQDFYKEETEYQTAQEQFEEDYPEIVVQGNEDDKDDYENIDTNDTDEDDYENIDTDDTDINEDSEDE